MSIRNTPNSFTDSPFLGVVPPQITAEALDLKFDINKFFSEYNSGNIPINTYYPILQKRMPGSLNNLVIMGNMMTDYAGSAGTSATHGYSLIQVGKASSGMANALGGYGVAWKPLTEDGTTAAEYTISTIKKVGAGEYEITLTGSFPLGGFPKTSGYLRIPYRSTETSVFTSIQFIKYLADGKTIRCLSGNAELIDGISVYTGMAIYMVKPNVYIVDNTSSVNDINLWDSLSDEMGFLSFLNCGVADIKANENYEFVMTITADGGIQFDITSPAFSLAAPARIPMYEYVAAEDTDSIGISVYGTDGYKWYYDNIKISSLDPQYPYLYCIFSTEGLRDSIYLRATARGYKSGGEESGMRIYALSSLGVWELIGYNMSDSMETISSDVIDRDDHVFRDKIHVMIIGAYTGDDQGNSILEVDGVSLINSESIAMHIGGFVDAYIDALCIETDIAAIPDVDTGSIYLDNSLWGVVGIIGVYRDGVLLSNYTDYNMFLDEYTFSCRGSISMSTRYVDGAFTIRALTCPGLVTINNYLSSRGLAPTGCDLLVKHRMVHYLDILGAERTTILPMLRTYVSELPRSNGEIKFDYSQFLFYLLQNNISANRVIIVDSYADNSQLKKSYLRSAGDSLTIDKASCIRISSGQ